MNVLIHDKQSGYQNTFNLGTSKLESIDLNATHVNNGIYVGTNISLRYEFTLSDKLKIAPQAMVYIPIPFSYEFTDSYFSTKSFRTYLEITFIKEL